MNPEWIEQALEATGATTLRKQRLPAEHVFWLVLGMALYRFQPMDDLVRGFDLILPVAGPLAMVRRAVAQARARLGAEPLKWLFERCVEKWAHGSATAGVA